MKKTFLIVIGTLLSFFSPTSTLAQVYVPTHTIEDVDTTLARIDIGGLTVCLPIDCTFNEELSMPNEGNFVWMTPNKKFMFICCLFETDESFTQEERLIGEAAQMGLELTGDGDIFNMKLDDNMYMSLTSTSKLSIGVCELFPDDHVGVCLFVLEPEAEDNSMKVFDIISSVRLSEENE